MDLDPSGSYIPDESKADFRNFEVAPAPEASAPQESGPPSRRHVPLYLLIIIVAVIIGLFAIIGLRVSFRPSTARVDAPSGYQIFQSANTPPRLEKIK